MLGLAPKWVRLAPNGTNPGLFQIGFQCQMHWNLIWKRPGFVPFEPIWPTLEPNLASLLTPVSVASPPWWPLTSDVQVSQPAQSYNSRLVSQSVCQCPGRQKTIETIVLSCVSRSSFVVLLGFDNIRTSYRIPQSLTDAMFLVLSDRHFLRLHKCCWYSSEVKLLHRCGVVLLSSVSSWTLTVEIRYYLTLVLDLVLKTLSVPCERTTVCVFFSVYDVSVSVCDVFHPKVSVLVLELIIN